MSISPIVPHAIMTLVVMSTWRSPFKRMPWPGSRLLVPEESFDRARDVVARKADVPEFPVVQGLKLVHRLAPLPPPEPTDDHPRESGPRARIVMIRHVSLRK